MPSVKADRKTVLISVLVFFVAFIVFLISPVRRAPDAKYSVLLSQSLMELRTFSLNYYSISPLKQQRDPRRLRPNVPSNIRSGYSNQLEVVDGKLFYYFPPGTSVLSIPFVAILNAFGLSAVNKTGNFNEAEEVKMQAIIAAFVTAFACCMFFLTARLYLPERPSLLISLGAAFGTQLWSSASRGLWSHAWGVLLLSIVLYWLLREEEQKKAWNIILFSTLTAWLFFIRPTFSIPIAGICVYLFLYRRDRFIPFCLIGFFWLALFVCFSLYNYGTVLPHYYTERFFSFRNLPETLAGNLISPSRGLITTVPIAGLLILLAIVKFRQLEQKRIVAMALVVIAFHLVAISLPFQWWGGNCFGARLSTDLVPWFVVLAIFVSTLSWSIFTRLFMVFILAFSIFINGRGALYFDTWKWNLYPGVISSQPERLWDWKHPQFLAGITYIPEDLK